MKFYNVYYKFGELGEPHYIERYCAENDEALDAFITNLKDHFPNIIIWYEEL